MHTKHKGKQIPKGGNSAINCDLNMSQIKAWCALEQLGVGRKDIVFNCDTRNILFLVAIGS